MTRTRRSFDDNFKASAIALAEKVSVPVAAAQLGIGESNLYNWIATAGSPGRRRQTAWSPEDYDSVAAEWVALRVSDPLESPTALVEKAQRKVFAGRGELQRDIPSVKNVAPLLRAIEKQWKALLDLPVVVPPPPEPVVQIVAIEIPRKLTFPEMLAQMDEVALEALLAAKRLARETTFHELLRGIAATAGATHLPTVTPFVPKLDAFEPVKSGSLKIAVVGLSGHSDELLAEVKNSGLDVVIRLPDPKDQLSIARSDYAIICRCKLKDAAASNSDGDRAIGQLGRSRVILLDDASTTVVMQQIRNLCSRK